MLAAGLRIDITFGIGEIVGFCHTETDTTLNSTLAIQYDNEQIQAKRKEGDRHHSTQLNTRNPI